MSQRVTDITLSQLLALPFKTAVFLLLSKRETSNKASVLATGCKQRAKNTVFW